METITDWADLWRRLVEMKKETQKKTMETPGDADVWNSRARDFNQRVKSRWSKRDSTRELMLKLLDTDGTILDIGAGTGAWAVLFANHLKRVTAVEPSRAMREVLIENITENGLTNVDVIPEKWPQADPSIHDYAFCSHAMYGVADFPTFVQHMIERASRMCFLLVRAPAPDGLITEAFQHVWQQPHDSPNFTIAYNILIQMGIYANVQIEDSDKWFFLSSNSVDEAFVELKNRLGLGPDDTAHDSYLHDLLERRLVEQDGCYLWPGGVQSALIYWKVDEASR